MSDLATSARGTSRVAVGVAGGLGVLLATALTLWAYYGTAVFTETILAGLAGCI